MAQAGEVLAICLGNTGTDASQAVGATRAAGGAADRFSRRGARPRGARSAGPSVRKKQSRGPSTAIHGHRPAQQTACSRRAVSRRKALPIQARRVAKGAGPLLASMAVCDLKPLVWRTGRGVRSSRWTIDPWRLRPVCVSSRSSSPSEARATSRAFLSDGIPFSGGYRRVRGPRARYEGPC